MARVRYSDAHQTVGVRTGSGAGVQVATGSGDSSADDLDPVATCTPREMLARGPRTAPGSDTQSI